MKSDWKEGKEGSVLLEDEEPDIFRLYLHWLYRCTLPVPVDEPGHLGDGEYLQLAKCYTWENDFKVAMFRISSLMAFLVNAEQ